MPTKTNYDVDAVEKLEETIKLCSDAILLVKSVSSFKSATAQGKVIALENELEAEAIALLQEVA